MILDGTLDIRRSSSRLVTSKPARYDDYALSNKLTYKSAIKLRPQDALPAVKQELLQMITLEVWHPVI